MSCKNVYLYPFKHKPSKRIFDILFSLFVLIVFSPAYLIISIMIFLTSGGSIFYISDRLGRGGKIIKCIKFRTMYKKADSLLHKLLKQNDILRYEWETFQKLRNDPRITPLGHFLRKTSLDELPQFINVLKGDLSVVGPRPFALIGKKENFQIEIKKYLGNKTEKILSMRPGITGIWQVSGRSEITIEERLKMEEKYIDEQSFLLDIYLILKTIPKIFFPRGAF
ncbi:MAG: UDP-glucose:undecaprenyl-phosphate glucose-1-phosphate transferase [Candidatus Anoxychlamydiales bacterium]|uniref:Bacterial sugar transferase domain-containing protein n=1 Tax=marine sediment metagenome TaxID=412755 RepID=A0A0F9FQ79_9ZZZZ|nr:UDP-glucose:undecaprenyl-phosphate glucose-1-phosphate transferase [Candidatus Anoxychlamydiales bacterium]HEU64344.1 sugar transferase [Chlamydiota bacterium]